MRKTFIATIAIALIMNILNTASGQDIRLPQPVREGGKPLMEALNDRQSAREFDSRDLTPRHLSDMLWAAWGFNRQEAGKRTAPSSRNVQEMDVYVSLKTGLYIYDAGSNTLKQVHNRDIRALCGTQEFVGTAPVNLIYVADMGKLGKNEGDEITDSNLLAPYANTGLIAQNVYLWCASEGVNCVIRAMIDRTKLAPEMKLRSNQVIILGQTVGYAPK